MNTLLFNALRAALTSDATDGGEPVIAQLTGEVNVAALAESADAPETEEDRQARKARLDRAREQAAKAANDGTAMPPELLGLAQQEIQICWKEFAGKDGVYDALKRARKGLSNISAHILNIAKACAVAAYERASGPDDDAIKLAGRLFRNAMGAAEAGLRGTLDLTDDDAEARLDEFLNKSWAVYKSQAKSGFDAGLDPRDSDSLYEVVKKVKAKKEASSTGTRTDDNRTEAPAGEQQGTQNAEQGEQGGAADADANGEDAEEGEEEGDTTPDTQALPDGSEVDIIAQGSAKIRGALILLHRAVHSVDIDVDNQEERLVNILRMATREINKLTMDEEELQESKGEEEQELSVQEG